MKLFLLVAVISTLILIGCDNNRTDFGIGVQTDARTQSMNIEKKQMSVELYFQGEYFRDDYIDSVHYNDDMLTLWFMKGIMKYEFYPMSEVKNLKIVVNQ